MVMTWKNVGVDDDKINEGVDDGINVIVNNGKNVNFEVGSHVGKFM